jgi:hypothetical protein
MADERGAKVLAADAVACQSAWRCPRVGGAIDPDALDDDHRTALARVRSLTGCSADDVRTCPGHYTRTAEAHELVRLHRWLKAGALPLRCPHPSGAVVDALDELASALGAREADDLERLRRKPKEAPGG